MKRSVVRVEHGVDRGNCRSLQQVSTELDTWLGNWIWIICICYRHLLSTNRVTIMYLCRARTERVTID